MQQARPLAVKKNHWVPRIHIRGMVISENVENDSELALEQGLKSQNASMRKISVSL
jgi:hypothetical protein